MATVRARWFALAYVMLVCAVATLAVAMASGGRPGSGMLGEVGRPISYVFPGGPAWNSGVREGQRLIAIESGERPEDWRMTVDQGRVTTIGAALWIDQLRATLPIALASALAAALAVVVLGLSRSAALAIATGALVFSEVPVMAQGDRVISTVVGVTALVAPVSWIAARLGWRRPLIAMLAATVALAMAWVASRVAWSAQFRSLEMLRAGVTWGALLVMVGLTGWRDVWPITGAYDRRRRTDALVLAVAAIGVSWALYWGSPPVPTLIVAALVIAGYPVVRGRVLAMADRVALGTVRERAALDAAEDERRRVAREIHDTAIQDLAALAARLERDLGAAGESAAGEVREVTEELRDITSRLASAELEDLGLSGALRGLVERSDRPGEMRVRLELTDVTAPDAPALPDDVAVGIYRIAQEAIRNAQRHSGGTAVVVRVRLSSDAVDLVVSDDGVGLDRVAVVAARERGHLGLASMRQRASSIDADLSIAGNETGTTITLRWFR